VIAANTAITGPANTIISYSHDPNLWRIGASGKLETPQPADI